MSLFNFLSIYEGPFEKKVDRFLRHLRIHSAADLEVLMQEDLVRLTIFLEYKFKGYKTLKKSYRKKLYRSAELLKVDFFQFLKENEATVSNLKKNLILSDSLQNDTHFEYLLLIMAYLKPGRILKYKASVNFEKLLRNPHAEKLVGDCNQIVTLYIYLYSLRYSIAELHVKILPEHICLHYNGQDIETTAGKLADYQEYTFISDVTEIIPTNLLDIPEPSEKRFKISPFNLLKSSEIAHQFSNHRKTVERNLLVAYQNLALYYTNKKQFKAAKKFAKQSHNQGLENNILRAEAFYFLNQKKYKKAASNFRTLNDIKGEKTCFQYELSDLLKKIKHFKTIAEYRKAKPTLRKVKQLALRLNNQKIVSFVNDLLRKF